MSDAVLPLGAVRGQEPAVAALERLAAAGGPVPPLLFHGPRGAGKRTAALAFAAALVCREPAGTDACATCSACRRVADAHHVTALRARSSGQDAPRAYPDAGLISVAGRKTRISVLQARDVTASLATRPFELSHRVYVVDPADRMTPAAANALLKALEEPPPFAVLVLVAESPWRLPITVRSRLRPLRFRPLPPSLIEELLVREGTPAAEAAERARQARGDLTRAREIDIERERSTIDAWVRVLERAGGTPRPAALAVAAAEELAATPDDARHALDLLVGITRDLAAGAEGRPPLYLDEEQLGRLSAGAASLVGFGASRAALVDGLCRETEIFNRNPRLALEGAVLALAGRLGRDDLILRG